MSSHPEAAKRPQAPQEMPGAEGVRIPVALTGVLVLLTIIGIAGFIAGVLNGGTQHAIQAFLVNFVFWASVAQGGVIVSASFYLSQGRWAGPAAFRLAESFFWFLPVAFLLFWVMFFWRANLWPWITNPALAHQRNWLNTPFFFAREGASLFIMALLSYIFIKLSRRRESRQWSLTNDDIDMPPKAIRRMAPILGITFCALYSMMAFDLVMSLAPDWKSTLFGWYFVGGAYWGGIVMMSFVAMILSKCLPAGNVFSVEKIRHDLGKMVFAFSVFWVYLLFAQYIVIWYGDIPTETFFLVVRGAVIGGGGAYTSWRWLTWAVPILMFALPFCVLMGQRPKKSPAINGSVALLGIIGLWLERYVLVVPSLSTYVIPFDWIELLVTLGFIGIFGLCTLPGLKLTMAAATTPQGLRSVEISETAAIEPSALEGAE